MSEQWVNDKLHDILGMSDRTVAEFLIGLAKKSSSEDGLINAMKQTGVIDVDPNVVGFATELYQKVPHAAPKVNQARIFEQLAVEQQRKNMAYRLVLSDDEEPSHSTKAHHGGSKTGKRYNKHIRQRGGKHSDEDDNTVVQRRKQPGTKRVKIEVPEDEDEFDKMEREREEDIKSRDEFAKRLKEKDETKTRSIVAKSDKKALAEAASRLKHEAAKKEEVVPELRLRSRRKYLEKRKEDKLLELEADIADDVRLWQEDELTEREKQELAYKKQILTLAKEHESARDIVKVPRYIMPEERRGKEDFQYEETDERERIPNSEQKKSEDEQMGFAQYKFGAKDARSKKHDKEYDIIIDEQIEFIQALTKPGNQKEKEKETETEKKRMTIEETQKSANLSIQAILN